MGNAVSPWVDKILPQLPGAIPAVAESEIVEAAREFFRDGQCWQDLVGPYTVGPDTGQVDLNPIDGRSNVIHVSKVFVFDRPAQWRSTGEPGVVILRYWPATEQNDAMTALVTLTPRDPTLWLPPMAYHHYFDAILDGALGRMYLHPMKPYTSDKRATFHLQRARARTREARDVARKFYTPDAVTWRFPWFGK